MTQWSPQNVTPLVTVEIPRTTHPVCTYLSKGVINYKRWHELCPWFYLQWAMTPSLKGKSLNSLASVFMDDRLALCFFLMSQVRVPEIVNTSCVPVPNSTGQIERLSKKLWESHQLSKTDHGASGFVQLAGSRTLCFMVEINTMGGLILLSGHCVSSLI